MKLDRFFPLAVLLAFPAAVFAGKTESPLPHERISLDADWRFIKADSPDVTANQLSYQAMRDWLLPTGNAFTTNAPAVKPEGEPGGTNYLFAQPDFNDSQWRLLNLPHDWGIEGPFKQELSGETGKLPWAGIAWYRKHLDIPASDDGKRIYLDVDGAMAYASVWCNGKFVGGWPYGYASWQVDLTPFLKFGGENVIAIRLDNPRDSSRWYPGGGIYRNVWLEKVSPVHVAHWGTYVTTQVWPTSFPSQGSSSLSAQSPTTIKMQVKLENDSDAPATISVKNEIFELKENGDKGKSVASTVTDGFTIQPRSSDFSETEITIQNPKLWSIENPQRYVVVTTVRRPVYSTIPASGNAKADSGDDWLTADRVETPFGIRTIQFTVDNGFLLNGKRVQIRGVCDHHDLGALGAAINVRALQRQIEILKSMGCNAIRTSHNPPAPELLDLCDKMGMLVMDESFDCWERGKTHNDYHLLFDDWHERDWRAELRRDRNHPSIILWSIGNEVGEQSHPDQFWIARELTGIAHQEDPTRPTTSANSDEHAGFNGFQTNEDVFGYNYKPFAYAKFRQANPNQPLFGSETASTVSSRGEYFFPAPAITNNLKYKKDDKSALADFQVSSYDYYVPGWATTPDAEWHGEDENPFVAGEFVWTGFDYLGEPTPYNRDENHMMNFTNPAVSAAMQKEFDKTGKILVPSRSSYFGIVDLCGFPKDRYYLYQAHWRPDFPMAHILPDWNWPDRVGKVTPVYVYTSGDEAELFLNGKSLGRKKKGQYEYRLEWNDVKYQPGTLKVVAYKNGKRWATDEVKTTGAPAKLELKADRDKIIADGNDLSFITVTVADKHGLQVPHSHNHIKFSIQGPGEIVATDNGDATSFESFQAPEHDAFNGLALVIVRSKAGETGKITLKAEADGLKSATIRIHSK